MPEYMTDCMCDYDRANDTDESINVTERDDDICKCRKLSETELEQSKVHFERKPRLDINTPFNPGWFKNPSRFDGIEEVNAISQDPSELPNHEGEPDDEEVIIETFSCIEDEHYACATSSEAVSPFRSMVDWSIVTSEPQFALMSSTTEPSIENISTRGNKIRDGRDVPRHIGLKYDDLYEGTQPKLTPIAHGSRVDGRSMIGASYLGPADLSELPEEVSLPIDSRATTRVSLPDGSTHKLLVDTGASCSMINRAVFDRNKWLQTQPQFKPLRRTKIAAAGGRIIDVQFIINVLLNIHGHRFQVMVMVAPISKGLEVLIGIKNLIEMEGAVDLRSMSLLITPRMAYGRSMHDCEIPPGESKCISLLADTEKAVIGRALFRIPSTHECNSYLVYFKDNVARVRITNNQSVPYKIEQNDIVGHIDLRSVGYYRLDTEKIHRMLDQLYEFETLDSLLDTFVPTSESSDPQTTENDPYPWLEKGDPRRSQTDDQLIRQLIDLEPSVLNR